MRILYVTQIVPYPPHGGVMQRGFNLLRELERRHDVHLLAFHHPNELPFGDAVEQSRRELGHFCSVVEYFELWPRRSRLHELTGLAAAAALQQPFSVLAHRSRTLRRRLQEICSGPAPPDLVHLDTIALAGYSRYCIGPPIVLAHHNIESQLMARRATYECGWVQRSYVRHQADLLRQLESRVANKFAVNITVSQADAEELRRICPSAVTEVILNGVDTDYFRPRGGQETPTLIFTGGMGMFANRDAVEWFVAEIWPSIKTRVPEARFIAIGKRPSPGVLSAAKRDPSIEVPGFVPDVRPWVERAAVYVVPMRVGGGTRLKVVDAMAQGKAIVSTTLGAEGIEGENGRHYLLADQPASFADSVVGLLQDFVARRRLGHAARELAENNYNWQRIGDRLADVYDEAIARSRIR